MIDLKNIYILKHHKNTKHAKVAVVVTAPGKGVIRTKLRLWHLKTTVKCKEFLNKLANQSKYFT